MAKNFVFYCTNILTVFEVELFTGPFLYSFIYIHCRGADRITDKIQNNHPDFLLYIEKILYYTTVPYCMK